MKPSTILVFFCVFALSELLLAAKLDHIRGVAAMKRLSGMRHTRSTMCPTDSDCDKMCKFDEAISGRACIKPKAYCVCDGGKNILMTKDRCMRKCEILGIGGGRISEEDGTNCWCKYNKYEIC